MMSGTRLKGELHWFGFGAVSVKEAAACSRLLTSSICHYLMLWSLWCPNTVSFYLLTFYLVSPQLSYLLSLPPPAHPSSTLSHHSPPPSRFHRDLEVQEVGRGHQGHGADVSLILTDKSLAAIPAPPPTPRCVRPRLVDSFISLSLSYWAGAAASLGPSNTSTPCSCQIQN